MLVVIFSVNQLVKPNHPPGPLLLSRIDAVDRFDLSGYSLFVPIQQFLDIAADSSKQFSEDLMKVFEIFTGSPNLPKHLDRQVLLQESLVARVPVPEDVFHKRDQTAVAFDMRLLPQEVDQPVVSGSEFIDFRGNRPQFAFRTDFGKKYREDSEKLLHQVVGGQNIGIQQAGDILLEKVRIPNENPPQLQIDDQCRKQFLGPSGLQGNDLKPRADVLNMTRVHLNLPFGGRSLKIRMLKTEGHKLIDEDVHQRMVVGIKNLSGQCGDAIDDRTPVLILQRQILQQPEEILHELMDRLLAFFLQCPSQAAIDLGQAGTLVIRQPGDAHHLEKKIELGQILMSLKSARLFQGIGDPKVSVCDLSMIGHLQAESQPIFFTTGLKLQRFQADDQAADLRVRKRRDQRKISFTVFLRFAVHGKPQGRIGLCQPVSVGRFKGDEKKPGKLLQIRPAMTFHDPPGNGLCLTR